MAIRTRNAFRPVVDEAVRASQAAIRDSASVAANTGQPARTATRPGVDAGGKTITLHVFTLGLDQLGAPGAFLRVRGKTRQYFRS